MGATQTQIIQKQKAIIKIQEEDIEQLRTGLREALEFIQNVEYKQRGELAGFLENNGMPLVPTGSRHPR